MATTDAKPGFRLPWGGDRAAEERAPEGMAAPPTDAASEGPEAAADPVTPGPVQENDEAMIDAAPTVTDPEAVVDAPGETTTETETAPSPTPAAVAPTAASPVAPAPRKTNKFLADLTKAMQAAAESARADTLERVAADAKAVVETIHASSASEATELRKRADDDVAAVREWSKNEIARIREETDERIAHRKERLEQEIEEHAARIEARIEQVQQRVAAFESQMQAFFERLLEEQDPTRFASMAESLPEPPPLDPAEAWEPVSVADPEPAPVAETAPAVEAWADTHAGTEAAAVATAEATDVVEVAPEPLIEETPVAGGGWPTEDATILHSHDESTAADAPDATEGEPSSDAVDPRVAMLGLDQDFAAAEAEAFAFTPLDDGSDEPLPELGDDLIAARLAGIVPDSDTSPAETAETRVVVVGLVSVASIAGFKRHLSRIPGVTHVGVTSGPDGEFIFTASHDPSTALRDAIPTLPGFGARVTGDVDGGLAVTAHDPEAEG